MTVKNIFLNYIFLYFMLNDTNFNYFYFVFFRDLSDNDIKFINKSVFQNLPSLIEL